MIPTDLKCHHRVDPEGIDTTTPRLSWAFAIDDKVRGQCQQVFRNLLADYRQNGVFEWIHPEGGKGPDLYVATIVNVSSLVKNARHFIAEDEG